MTRDLCITGVTASYLSDMMGMPRGWNQFCASRLFTVNEYGSRDIGQVADALLDC